MPVFCCCAGLKKWFAYSPLRYFNVRDNNHYTSMNCIVHILVLVVVLLLMTRSFIYLYQVISPQLMDPLPVNNVLQVLSPHSSCSVCSAGQYSEIQAVGCMPCKAGFYGNTAGLSSALCTSICPIGYRLWIFYDDVIFMTFYILIYTFISQKFLSAGLYFAFAMFGWHLWKCD